MIRLLAIFAFLITFSIVPASSQATSVLPSSIEDMTARAHVVFVGTCQKRETTSAPGLMGRTRHTDTWTFSVSDVLKGDLKTGDPFVWKQIGQSYTVGKEYLLFLVKLPNDLLTPVGMVQGKFDVITNADGTKDVKNGFNNDLLFHGVANQGATKGAKSQLSKSGPLPLDTMKELVHQLRSGHK
jgi:hypothetical protein